MLKSKMNTNLDKKLQVESIKASVNSNTDNFDFDVWSAQVRHQMLTCLQRRLKKEAQSELQSDEIEQETPLDTLVKRECQYTRG